MTNGMVTNFIKILGVKLDNSILNNSNWDKISEGIMKKIHILNRMRLFLIGKKIIINQILLSKLRYIGQIYTIPKYIGRKLKEYRISSGTGKAQPPKHLAQLSIWRGRLGILDIGPQLNFLKIKRIQRFINL